MAKRNFHFFKLEDRVLLSGEGLDPALEMVPDGDVIEGLLAEADAIQTSLDAIEEAAFAAVGEATPEQQEQSDLSALTDLPNSSPTM